MYMIFGIMQEVIKRLGVLQGKEVEDNSFGKGKPCHLVNSQMCHSELLHPCSCCQECLPQSLPHPVGLSSDQMSLPLQSSSLKARWSFPKANTGNFFYQDLGGIFANQKLSGTELRKAVQSWNPCPCFLPTIFPSGQVKYVWYLDITFQWRRQTLNIITHTHKNTLVISCEMSMKNKQLDFVRNRNGLEVSKATSGVVL